MRSQCGREDVEVCTDGAKRLSHVFLILHLGRKSDCQYHLYCLGEVYNFYCLLYVIHLSYFSYIGIVYKWMCLFCR